MRTFASRVLGLPRAALLIAALLAGAGAAGCAESDSDWQVADREFRDFQLVYPFLLRDCGFQGCHGSEERFFRVYGPGRTRLDPDTAAYAATTGNEASASFLLARSMIDADHPERSLLLRKPLAIEAGGVSHGGADRFGRNVYRTADDEGYLAIARFVFAMPDPDDE